MGSGVDFKLAGIDSINHQAASHPHGPVVKLQKAWMVPTPA